MMRLRVPKQAIVLVLISAALLSACTTKPVTRRQSTMPFQITPTVEKNWQHYLDQIGETNSGAFAVSVDGYGSHYVYCDTSADCGAVDDALKKCRKSANMDCLVMARGRQPEFAFEVAVLTRPIADDSPIRQNLLDSEGLKQRIVGNTISGEYINGIKWREYLAPDGKIYGRDDAHGDYTATYKIKDDKICTDYPGESSDNCIRMSLEGNRIEHMNEQGEHDLSLINTVLLPGNAVQ